MLSHSYSFDPTHGYTLETLLKVAPPEVPAGFVEFWQETYALAMKTPPRAKLTQIPSSKAGTDIFEIEFDGINGFRVGGWVTRPTNERPTRGLVVGHGYGGRAAPELTVAGPPAVAIFPCARGFNRSARADLPGECARHVVFGIESPESYVLRFCVADLFSAVSALLEIAPEINRLDYSGSSFSGGVGALMLPWEKRIGRAFLAVPSFGHYDLRLSLPCVGSGQPVRELYERKPEIRRTLDFHDSAVAARFCRTPTMVSAALFDPAVPPPGQFAVYNALAGEKHLHVREADHFEWPGAVAAGAKQFREQHRWFETNGG